MQPEKRITDAITCTLRSLPRCWCFKVHGGPMQTAGIPDILGVLDGRFFAIEVKAPGNRVTDLQALTMRRITEAGGIAGVATTASEALTLLGKG